MTEPPKDEYGLHHGVCPQCGKEDTLYDASWLNKDLWLCGECLDYAEQVWEDSDS